MVINIICEELKEINKIVDNYIFIEQPPRTPVQTPAWDTVVNSGLLIKMLDCDYYLELVKCYSYIKILNEDIITNDDIEIINKKAEKDKENNKKYKEKTKQIDRSNMERLKAIDKSIDQLNEHLHFKDDKGYKGDKYA